LQPLHDAPRLHPVHDVHGHYTAVAQVKERPVIIARRQRLIHLIEPRSGVVLASGALGQRHGHCTDHGAWNQPSCTAMRLHHGALRESWGNGWCNVASFTAAPFTERPLSSGSCTSASASSPD